MNIRQALLTDLEAINQIYNYYVIHSTCTYQTIPETMEDRRIWFEAHLNEYPVWVIVIDGIIAGWGALSPFHKRQAFKPTAENSVYIHPDYQQKGLGSQLLKTIIDFAQSRSYHSIIASISADQTASIALHEKFGFQPAGRLREAGYKFDRWLDVVYYQCMLNGYLR